MATGKKYIFLIKKYWSRILPYFSAAIIIMLIYFFSREYIIDQVERRVRDTMLEYKAFHQYVQYDMHPAYYRLINEGYLPDGFYSPELLSSSYIARNIQRHYNEERQEAGLPEVSYKIAAIDPRNPVNKATPMEEELITWFNEDHSRTVCRKIIEEDGQKFLLVSQPFLEVQPQCLKCHGDRKDAPVELLEQYSWKGAWDLEVGEIIAAEFVRSPLKGEFNLVIVLTGGLILMLGSGFRLLSFNKELHHMVERKIAEQQILEKKNLEEKCQQAKRVESIVLLAGGVAHDLNNMLTPVIGFSELLLADRGISESQELWIGQIREAGMRSRDLVGQLLAFSRNQTLNMEPIELKTVLENLKDQLKSKIPDNITVHYDEYREKLPLIGDLRQLEQVVMNLAINAADAMPEGGKLSLRTNQVNIDQYSDLYFPDFKPGVYAELIISDTGMGMKAGILDKIFDPFFTTKGNSGTGLGLPAVYGIIQQHHGNIRVESEPARGSVFHIYLPIAEKDSNSRSEITPS